MLNLPKLQFSEADVFDATLLDEYKRMGADGKIETLDHILDMDVPPLDMVVAFYAVIKPDRAVAMAEKLRALF